MKLEIELNERDAAHCWANHNEQPLAQTISDMVWKDAADWRGMFPNMQKKVIKEFSAMIPLLEPESLKCLRLALGRLEQLATTERDGLLVERIQRALNGQIGDDPEFHAVAPFKISDTGTEINHHDK